MSISNVAWATSKTAGGPLAKLCLLLIADWCGDGWLNEEQTIQRLVVETEATEAAVRKVVSRMATEAGLLFSDRGEIRVNILD